MGSLIDVTKCYSESELRQLLGVSTQLLRRHIRHDVKGNSRFYDGRMVCECFHFHHPGKDKLRPRKPTAEEMQRRERRLDSVQRSIRRDWLKLVRDLLR